MVLAAGESSSRMASGRSVSRDRNRVIVRWHAHRISAPQNLTESSAHMHFPTDGLTVFGFLVPAWSLEMTSPLLIAAAAVCVCTWLLIGADLRRSEEIHRHQGGDRQP